MTWSIIVLSSPLFSYLYKLHSYATTGVLLQRSQEQEQQQQQQILHGDSTASLLVKQEEMQQRGDNEDDPDVEEEEGEEVSAQVFEEQAAACRAFQKSEIFRETEGQGGRGRGAAFAMTLVDQEGRAVFASNAAWDSQFPGVAMQLEYYRRKKAMDPLLFLG